MPPKVGEAAILIWQPRKCQGLKKVKVKVGEAAVLIWSQANVRA